MNKTAVVTGAGGGIGAELARLYAADGFDLVLAGRNVERLESMSKELSERFNASVRFVSADLSTDEGVDALYDFTKKNNITVSALVNNAGFGDFGTFADCDLEKQAAMIRLNVLALTRLTRLYVGEMLAHGEGEIFNLGSVASFQAGPLMSVYYATKAYVLSFTEALAAELKGTGVKVSVLCPGPTRTGFEAAAGLKNSGLFKNLKTASAAEVARTGYERMKKGKLITIPGAANRALIFASKLAPRRLSRWVVYQIQRIR